MKCSSEIFTSPKNAMLKNRHLTVSVVILALFYLTGGISVIGQSEQFDMARHYQSYQHKNLEEFISGFPYTEYLEKVNIVDIQRLQKDRYYLWLTEYKDGDQFLLRLGDFYVEQNPLNNINDVARRVEVAEAYLVPEQEFDLTIDSRKLNSKTNDIYMVMGYFFLSTAARWIGDENRNGRIQLKDYEAIIKRMNEKKVFVEITESGPSKAQNRTVEEVLDKGTTIAQENRGPLFWLLSILTVCCLISTFFFNGYWRGIPIFITLGLLAAIIFLWLNPPIRLGGTLPQKIVDNRDVSPTPLTIRPTSCEMRPHDEFAGYSTNSGMAIEFYRLLYQTERKEIGQVIKLRRSDVRLSYYVKTNAQSSVQDWLAKIQEKDNIILVTSGGYSNAKSQPEGLTFENGSLINAVLLPDRKGLVAIKNFGLEVFDLKNGSVSFATRCRELVKQPKSCDPFVNLATYAELVTWARTSEVTSFQTHLLALGDKILIDAKASEQNTKANYLSTERRVLAEVQKLGQPSERFYFVFNLNTKVKLGELSIEIFHLLKNSGFSVLSMVNLDTGQYDIIEVFTADGRPFTSNGEHPIKGKKDLVNATNLIAFHTSK